MKWPPLRPPLLRYPVFAAGAPRLGDLHLQCPVVHFLAVELLDREQRNRAPETGSDEEGGSQRTDDRTRPQEYDTGALEPIASLLRRAILENRTEHCVAFLDPLIES